MTEEKSPSLRAILVFLDQLLHKRLKNILLVLEKWPVGIKWYLSPLYTSGFNNIFHQKLFLIHIEGPLPGRLFKPLAYS